MLLEGGEGASVLALLSFSSSESHLFFEGARIGESASSSTSDHFGFALGALSSELRTSPSSAESFCFGSSRRALFSGCSLRGERGRFLSKSFSRSRGAPVNRRSRRSTGREGEGRRSRCGPRNLSSFLLLSLSLSLSRRSRSRTLSRSRSLSCSRSRSRSLSRGSSRGWPKRSARASRRSLSPKRYPN